jgi:hypothetical protein
MNKIYATLTSQLHDLFLNRKSALVMSTKATQANAFSGCEMNAYWWAQYFFGYYFSRTLGAR